MCSVKVCLFGILPLKNSEWLQRKISDIPYACWSAGVNRVGTSLLPVPSSPAYMTYMYVSHNLYDKPGHVPYMKVLFWGQRDFPRIRHGAPGIVTEEVLVWNDILRIDHLQLQSTHDIINELDLLSNYEWFPKIICDGCGLQTGGSSSFGHMVPTHLGLAHVLYVLIPMFSRICDFRKIPRYFLDSTSIQTGQQLWWYTNKLRVQTIWKHAC